MKGDFCPTPNTSLVFRLQVDGLGTSLQTLIIPVVPAEKSKIAKIVKKEPLAVTKKLIQANGKLTLGFNSAVLWDKLQIGEGQVTSRLLQQQAATTAGYPISDLVQISVENDGSGEENESSRVSGVSLMSSSETELVIMIDFADPSSVSADIREPDYLRVEFSRPDLVLQSETFDQMPVEETIFTLPIVP